MSARVIFYLVTLLVVGLAGVPPFPRPRVVTASCAAAAMAPMLRRVLAPRQFPDWRNHLLVATWRGRSYGSYASGRVSL